MKECIYRCGMEEEKLTHFVSFVRPTNAQGNSGFLLLISQ
jgi:hypothetical protein